MKIAILADPLDGQYAGIHIYTREFINAIIQYDKLNEYILIRQKKSIEYPQLQQVVVPNLPVYTGFQVLRLFFIFPIILRKLKVDAVLEPAHFGPFNLPKRIKRITVIHDLTPILFPELHRFYSQTLQRIFLQGILKKADLILTNSDHTSRDTIAFCQSTQDKIKRIYLGKDEQFTPTACSKTIDKFDLERPYFLSVGTIEPRKNLLLLLSAYEQFRRSGKERVRLLVVGKRGWKAQAIMNELENHPFKEDIKVLGYVNREELPVLYSKTLALIYPSIYEGFGLPVLEAMSCGAPCILSDSSSLPEVGGDAACYFKHTDSKKLFALMKEIFQDKQLRNSMRKKSLEQAAKFSWNAYAEAFVKAIETLK